MISISKAITKIKKAITFISLIIYYQFMPCTLGINKKEYRHKKIVLSLTTYSKRLHSLHLCLRSLLNQNYRPDKVILYLGNDLKINQLSHKILKLRKFGLEIIEHGENLKSHKKYYYAMKSFPEDIVITVDDDCIYDRHLVESLVNSYKRFPYAVSCRRANKITFDEKKNILPYSQWVIGCKEFDYPSMLYLATGVGGVLYPPHSLDKEVFNKVNIYQLCLPADDIWLKCMQILKRTPTVIVRSNHIHPFLIPYTSRVALANSNVLKNKNDLYIKKVAYNYHIDFRALIGPLEFQRESDAPFEMK